VYTHPFTIFTAGGHVTSALRSRQWRLAVICGLIGLGAAASFLPWMIYARSGWQETMIVSRFQFTAGWKTPLMILRELSGAGYWGSGLLLVSAAAGARAIASPVLLAAVSAVTLVGGIAADAALGYFVAARQFICALPPLAVMTTARPNVCLVAALLSVCVWKNCQYFRSANEDWESASAAIAAELHPGRCLVVEPARQFRLYATLVPSLASARCGADGPELVLAVSPYREAQSLVLPKGYTPRAERSVGGTRILILTR
jgi:hypothetical protein